MQAKLDTIVTFTKKNLLFVFALSLVFIFLLIVFIVSSTPATNNIQPNQGASPTNQNSQGGSSPTASQILNLNKPEKIFKHINTNTIQCSPARPAFKSGNKKTSDCSLVSKIFFRV